MHISWSNSLVGNGVRGLFPRNPSAKPDWRFNVMISIAHIVPVGDATIKVPPGEVTVTIVEAEQVERVARDEVNPHHDAAYTTLGLWPTECGRTIELSLPEFGSIVGQLEVDAGLPDWGNSRTDYGNISADLFERPAPPRELLRLMQIRGNRDRPQLAESDIPGYLAFLKSEAGIDFRRKTMFRSRAAINKEGKFRLDFMPEGAHRVMWNVRVPRRVLPDSFGNVPPANAMAYSSYNIYSKGKKLMQTVRYMVKAGEVNDVGVLESDATDPFTRGALQLTVGWTVGPGVRLGNNLGQVGGQPIQANVMSPGGNNVSFSPASFPPGFNSGQQASVAQALTDPRTSSVNPLPGTQPDMATAAI